ncbi:MAG TPA: UrcA family protein [Steroidobacteraceae bacterium]
MNIRRILRRPGLLLLVAGLCLGTTAFADNLKTITIGAGVLTKTVVDHSVSTGAPIEEVTVTHRVSYADLDLRTQAGAAELRRRVEETARVACKQLDDLYPLEEKKARECADTAIADASPQVRNALAAVRRQAKAR